MKKKITDSNNEDLLNLLDKKEQKELYSLLQIESKAEFSSFATTDVLLSIVQLRSPFIKMFREISLILSKIKAAINGNIQFIALPSAHESLEVEFSEQLNKYTTLALDPRLLANKSDSILQLVGDFKKKIYILKDIVQPSINITEYSEIGDFLREKSQLLSKIDPINAFKNDFLAERLSNTVSYYHPHDLERLINLEADASVIIKKLEYTKEENSDNDQNTIYQTFRIALKQLSILVQKVKEKSYKANAENYMPLRNHVFVSAQTILTQLTEIFASISFQQEAINELFDFMKLTLWKERWRIYELWLLCKLILIAQHMGAILSLGNRLQNGKWALKFTKDTTPVANLNFNGTSVDLYYQLFEAGNEGNNMPDIALKSLEYGNLLVLDPKHGLTYRLKELKEVCSRYAKAFNPVFSCVANYYPPKEKKTKQIELSENGMILYNIQPGSATLQLLEQKISKLLNEKIPGVILKTLWILFDVSSSTKSVNQIMTSDLKSMIEHSFFNESSCIIPFSVNLHKSIEFNKKWDELDLSPTDNGTNIDNVLNEISNLSNTSTKPTHLWVFTDGQDSIDISLLVDTFQNTSITIFDYCDSASESLLKDIQSTSNIVYLSKSKGDIVIE